MKKNNLPLKQSWAQISAWVDARKLGERAALFAAIAALLILVMNQVFLHSASVKIALLSKQLEMDRTSASTSQTEIALLAAKPVVDPDAQNKARLATLKQEEAAAQVAIGKLGNDLVAPEQMSEMLRQILARQGKLHLLSLVKLPIQSLNTNVPQVVPANAGGAGNPGSAGKALPAVVAPTGTSASARASDVVYKHGVEIVVQGSYAELTDYLVALEHLPMQVVWGSLKLRVDDYPKTTLTLTLYTLSLEKKWLNI